MRKLLLFLLVVFTAFIFGQKTFAGDNLFIDKGETETIELAADTYQGYEWIVEKIDDPSIVKFEGKENEFGEKNTDLTNQILKFKGLKKGKTKITLQYIKQGEMLPKKSKVINVRVFD